MTFRIRNAQPGDAEQVLAVAEHLDTVNLPASRAHIDEILAKSNASFAGELPPSEREFLFVLEQLPGRRIVGTSILYAQHGTKRAPHIFFRVENDERYSVTLDKYFVHQTLRIGYNYHGPTEIGGLILLPEFRGHKAGLGKALSFVRFLFIAMHREWFRERVLSELLPPLEADGTSLLWEHLGRRFTGLSYQEADVLSKHNKEFIHSLFPDDPIHTELLSDDVRAIIGQVGAETKGVEAMLRRIGFAYAGQIDPFDGGPHFVANTDDITVVRSARQLPVAAGVGIDANWALVARERASAPWFEAVVTAAEVRDGAVRLAPDVMKQLDVADGGRVWLAQGG